MGVTGRRVKLLELGALRSMGGSGDGAKSGDGGESAMVVAGSQSMRAINGD